MLTGLIIRDVVLIEALDLTPGPGLTVLTGETGAGKSIVLDALGLATGARAEAALVRRGASQAVVSALFEAPPSHPAWALLEERGLAAEPGEGLVLRRLLSVDGRSRAFVNDQPVGVGVLRELGGLLIEVHGQHDAVGLLDVRGHRALLDGYGDYPGALADARASWSAWRDALAMVQAVRARVSRDAAEAETLGLRLAELDRLDPRDGEEARLAERRTLLGSAEKVVADIAAAREALSAGQITTRLSQAARSLERARERLHTAEPAEPGEAAPAPMRLAQAAEAVERALIEADEAGNAVDAAAQAFVFDPSALELAEERLFALRAAARKLGVPVDALPAERVRIAQALIGLESADAELADAERNAATASGRYRAAADALSLARKSAAGRLAEAVQAELQPLKLNKARFHVAVEPLPEERAGPDGQDRVAFEVSTNPGAPFGSLGDIASGGELARFALALKVALAGRRRGEADARKGPVMIFDEVDQGVGGAVADAVGLRLKQLAQSGQVLVVTHSPQVAARADSHWRVSKQAHAGAKGGDHTATAIDTLAPQAREEELARMLAGAEITEAARAAARALMGA